MSTQRTLGVGKYLLVGTGLLVFAYYILRLTILNADAATNGLVAAYNFDAGTGTTLTDISATGNSGTITGPIWDNAGKNGKALSFDGSNDYVNIPDSNSLDLTDGMTLEAWVKPTALGTNGSSWRTVLFKHKTGGQVYAMYANNGSARPVGQINITAEKDAIGTSQLQLNTWSHLTTTYDGANLRFYVNGTLVSTTLVTGNIPTTTGVLRMGGNSVWGEWFKGSIDDVRIYNRALSASEIQSDMGTPVMPPVTDTEAPSVPSNLALSNITENSASLSWAASSDNAAVGGYGIYKDNNLIHTVQGTTTSITGLACGSNFAISVDAFDGSGNRSDRANLSLTTSACDTSPPSVSITSPAGNTTLTGSVTVSAAAADNKSVTGVQFKLDGNNLGAEDTIAPYSVTWDTTAGSNGNYVLTAVAKDSSNNQSISSTVSVTVNNTQPNFVNDQMLIGLSEPTDAQFLPDGRMLVAERDGTVWSVMPGATQVNPLPFIQLPNVSTDNERGLLGMTIDPNFAQNGYVYLFYTHSDLKNRVSRFTANGDTAPVGSEFIVWQNNVNSDIWHQGGEVAFGPDGYLYISVGDHLQSATAQSLTSYNGKILRIAKDGSAPTDNPFYDGNGPNVDAIWVRGLRNPFRFSIDQQTGRMFIGDVGQGSWEEVNIGAKGANYGWPTCEGNCSVTGMTNPVYTYSHANNHDASVTGGFVYRGNQFPAEYQGNYFFADYAMNWIKRLTFDTNGNFTGVQNFIPANGANDGPYGDIVALTEGPDGSLWYVDAGPFATNNAGSVRRIKNTNANQAPSSVIAADKTNGVAPLGVTFSSAGSVDPEGQPLTYNWNFGDGSTSTDANPSHVFSNRGRYVVRLTTSDGTNITVSSPITITVGSPPAATILTPSNGGTFKAGDAISFTGEGSDPDDGVLSGNSLSWKIVYHHDSHIHPVMEATPGNSGSITIPTSGHSFHGNTNYEIVLTVTDSDGIQTTTSVTVYPQKANITFNTAPAGLSINVNGQPNETPFVYDELVGFQFQIEATSPQFLNGNRYSFESWSDGGVGAHTITVPEGGQTLQANFNQDTAAPVGLIAAYNFNEGNGNTLYDVSGHSHDGTLSGPIWSGSGKNGGALLFDGVNDYVSIPDHSELDLTNGMTLEAWVNPSALGNVWRTVLFKEQSSHMTYALYAGTDNGLPTGQAYVSGERDARGTVSILTGAWTHLATTYDGTSLKLYVNGTLVKTQSASGTMTVSNGVLKIGGNGIWGEWYRGLIDDVRIYSRSLTPSEIQSDMNLPVF